MAVGKNKGLNKSGKKGSKKKVVDPFSRKDWYNVKAPNMFQVRQIGKTMVNRTVGQKIASDNLKGRVFEVSLCDLQQDVDPERSYRKFRLISEDVQESNILCNFHGMDLTTDKYCFMVKKWQSLIEAAVDAKTTDGYVLRVFCIGFTTKDLQTRRKTCYAQQSQVRRIRARMTEIIVKEVSSTDLKQLVSKFALDSIAKDIEKSCQSIYPLHDVYLRKVKVLKKPRFDLFKLLEFHCDSGKPATTDSGNWPEEGVVIDRPANYEPPVQESV